MNRVLVLAASLAALLVAGPIAQAKKGQKKQKPFPMLTHLVKKGILKEDDLAGIKAMAKENHACFEDKKQNKQPFTACFPKVIEQVKAQIALFEKTIPTIQSEKLRAKAEKVLGKLRENLTKLEAKAAAPAPAPAPATAP